MSICALTAWIKQIDYGIASHLLLYLTISALEAKDLFFDFWWKSDTIVGVGDRVVFGDATFR